MAKKKTAKKKVAARKNSRRASKKTEVKEVAEVTPTDDTPVVPETASEPETPIENSSESNTDDEVVEAVESSVPTEDGGDDEVVATVIEPKKLLDAEGETLVGKWVSKFTKLRGRAKQDTIDRAITHHNRGLLVLTFIEGGGREVVQLSEYDYNSRDRVRSAAARFAPRSFLHEFIRNKGKK